MRPFTRSTHCAITQAVFTMDTNEDGRSAISGSLENARELLSAARALLDARQPARLAYHFAALALEEVGKASVLGMRVVRSARDRDVPSPLSDEALQDHVRKLFWAIWGPTIGRDVITSKQIEEMRGLAQQLHIRRMQGLYVDSTGDGVSLPVGSISRREHHPAASNISPRTESISGVSRRRQ